MRRVATKRPIEPEITMAGCEKFRVVIRNDGSGGHREVWHNDKWVKTKWDHGLTPADSVASGLESHFKAASNCCVGLSGAEPELMGR